MIQGKIENLIVLAKTGDASAMLSLGFRYENGDGVEKDYKSAFNYYRNAGEAGNLIGYQVIAINYSLGVGYEQNLALAEKWYKKAASKGDAFSLIQLMDAKGRFKRQSNWALKQYLSLFFPVYNRFVQICDSVKSLSCKRNFLELMRTVVDVENLHLYKNTNELGLTHYTSQIVLDALLGGRRQREQTLNKKIRLYMSAYLNDPTEGRYFLSENFDNSPTLQDIDLELIRNRFEDFWQDGEQIEKLPAQMYSVSLSSNPDNLDLWRAYGKDAKGQANGIGLQIPQTTLQKFAVRASKGLGFKDTKLADLPEQSQNASNFLLYEVHYGESAVTEMWQKVAPQVTQALKAIKNLKGITKETENELNHCVVLSLMRLSYLYKHDAYESEAEVRAIRMGALNDVDLKMDEREPSRLYFDSPDVLFQDSGSAIILGPQMTGEERAVLLWETRKRLLDLGLAEKVNVRSSKVPYR